MNKFIKNWIKVNAFLVAGGSLIGLGGFGIYFGVKSIGQGLNLLKNWEYNWVLGIGFLWFILTSIIAAVMTYLESEDYRARDEETYVPQKNIWDNKKDERWDN